MIQILDQVGGIVKSIADKFIPDAKDRLEAENMFYKMAHQVNLGQIEINKEEAKHPSVFVSGWRPFIGWVCGANLAYSVILHSALTWIIQTVALLTGQALPALPSPDMSLTLESLFGLLGMGALRTYEKTQGVARS